jgi:hypothetical protein
LVFKSVICLKIEKNKKWKQNISKGEKEFKSLAKKQLLLTKATFFLF